MNLKIIPGSKIAIPFLYWGLPGAVGPQPRAGVGFLVGLWPWSRSWGGMTGPGAHTGMVPSQPEPQGGMAQGNAFYCLWLHGHHLRHGFLCDLALWHTRPQY